MRARSSIPFPSARTTWPTISRMPSGRPKPSAQRPWRGEYLLSRAVRDAGYKVVLTGEGSDEILGGYAHFRRDMLLHNTEGQDPAGFPGSAGGAGGRQSGLARAPAAGRRLVADGQRPPLLGFVPPGSRSSRRRAAKMHELLSPAISSKFAAQEPSPSSRRIDVPRQLAGRDALNQSLYLWSKTVLPGYILPCWATGWRWRIPSRAECPSSTTTLSK